MEEVSNQANQWTLKDAWPMITECRICQHILDLEPCSSSSVKCWSWRVYTRFSTTLNLLRAWHQSMRRLFKSYPGMLWSGKRKMVIIITLFWRFPTFVHLHPLRYDNLGSRSQLTAQRWTLYLSNVRCLFKCSSFTMCQWSTTICKHQICLPLCFLSLSHVLPWLHSLSISWSCCLSFHIVTHPFFSPASCFEADSIKPKQSLSVPLRVMFIVSFQDF